MHLSTFGAAALLAVTVSAKAVVVESVYTRLGADQWFVSLNVFNDANPPISEFTIYFSEQLFQNLSLSASPSTWNSLLIQPDLGLPAAGFVDGLVLDSANALSVGKNQSGFVVNFTYLTPTTPGSLPFDVLDANFQLIAAGSSTVSVITGSIPEPSAVLLWSLAIGLLVTRKGLNEVLGRSNGPASSF